MTSADDQMAEVQAQKKYIEKVCPRCKSARLEENFPSAPFNEHLDQIYTPLVSAQKEIRILKIYPGLTEEPLRCSLQPASLDDARYSALSYCWGDGNDRRDIAVNGRIISVTKNLENALRHLKNRAQDVAIWADAICINQQDLAEKSIQVGMMGNIYSKGKI
jgi:phage FluMu protein Com